MVQSDIDHLRYALTYDTYKNMAQFSVTYTQDMIIYLLDDIHVVGRMLRNPNSHGLLLDNPVFRAFKFNYTEPRQIGGFVPLRIEYDGKSSFQYALKLFPKSITVPDVEFPIYGYFHAS